MIPGPAAEADEPEPEPLAAGSSQSGGSGCPSSFGQRYYNPASGAWSQQDSIERLGDPSQGNRYASVTGDPVNGTDPTGSSALGYVFDAFNTSSSESSCSITDPPHRHPSPTPAARRADRQR